MKVFVASPDGGRFGRDRISSASDTPLSFGSAREIVHRQSAEACPGYAQPDDCDFARLSAKREDAAIASRIETPEAAIAVLSSFMGYLRSKPIADCGRG